MFDWDGIPEDPDELEAAAAAAVAAAERRELEEERIHEVGAPRSGGEEPCAAHNGGEGSAGARRCFEIGGVSLPVAPGPPSALVPGAPSARGDGSLSEPSADVPAPELAALRWMMQKAKLRQDMFLLAPPGPAARRLVLRFCALFGRELEYLAITADTSESDLKQRRELRGGRVEYDDQPPVRAALAGRVLLLEGIEKAERNVLPLLNNLLENREMQLEDRRFLLSPERAAALAREGRGCGGACGDFEGHLVPVHKDFLVVAIGMPSRGSPLDPPLRSRFSAYALRTAPGDGLTAIDRLGLPLPPAALAALKSAAGVLQGAHGGGDADGRSAVAPGFPEGGLCAVARLLGGFPGSSLAAALRRVYPFEVLPGLSPAQRQRLEKAAAAFRGAPGASGGKAPRDCVVISKLEIAKDGREASITFDLGAGGLVDARASAGGLGAGAAAADAAAADAAPPSPGDADLGAVRALPGRALRAWLAERGVPTAGCVEKADFLRKAQAFLAAQPSAAAAADGGVAPTARGVLARPLGGLRLTGSQAQTVAAMLMDHAVGADLCILGEQGSGKSALVRAFAALLGYRCRVTFCYKDMIARELLQRRATDPRGNTEWRDSALVEAAVSGDVAVLDGAHRLPAGALAGALGALLADREAPLPDGSRLVAPRRWEALVRERGLPADCRELLEGGVRFRPVHPAFRCVATAVATPGRPSAAAGGGAAWLNEEVLTMFHFHVVAPLPNDEQLALALAEAGGCADAASTRKRDEPVFRGLIAYGEQIRQAAANDLNLEPLRLSVRTLLRVARHLRCRPGDVQGALFRAFSACLRFLPPPSQEAVDRLLVAAMRGAGVPVGGLRRDAAATAPSDAEALGRRRELRELEAVAIQARMFGGFGGEEVDAARERAEQERRDQRQGRLDALRRLASAAASGRSRPGAGGGAAAGGALRIATEGGRVRIGDVACDVREAERPELVPDVAFVDIPRHVEALRDMLLDWSLGHNLLLIGNQGVGKNKLADRLLGLLRCEREYVQLHRDTTVQSLLLSPTLHDGAVVWEDSPLVRAVRHGRCLVVDEADKAPLEVVCVLKALCDDGELALPDGRVVRRRSTAAAAGSETVPGDAGGVIAMTAGFRLLVLANRPGYPFLGNDFYGTCGDVFSCHTIDNPDIESEVALLRSVGPDVPADRVAQLAVLFAELRDMVEAGQLGYPYSTRELVKLVSHLQRFPDDAIERVAADVFALDVADPRKRPPLLEVLARHGIATSALGRRLLMGEAKSHGNMDLRLDDDRDKSKDVVNPDNPDGSKPPDMANGGPRHGDWDGGQHIGGNRFAGGSGGTGTAGLGGRWGPYRLDVGQKFVQVPEVMKQGLDAETKRKAQQMADEAYRKRLEELRLSPGDAAQYEALRAAVAPQVQEMKVCLESQEARERERQWLRLQTHGELDDSRLVDGITGARAVYMRRGEPDGAAFGMLQKQPKRVTFVMDISGSMYTFNRIDGRLRRLQEVAVFLFESFAGFEAKYDYRMVGHSGTGPEAERLVEWGRPPHGEKERLAIAKTMEAHAQFCYPGDHTLEGTSRAIDEIGRQPADERFVFVVSDADLQRYSIDVRAWNRILQKDPSVKAYVILISNNVDEAERIKATLAPGRAHICAEAASLAVTFRQIFQDSMLRSA